MKAVDRLLDQMWSSDKDERDRAKAQLVEMGPGIVPYLLGRAYHSIGTEDMVYHPQYVVLEEIIDRHPTALLDGMDHEDYKVRAGAADVSGWIAESWPDITSLKDRLIELLKNDPQAEVQYLAMVALNDISPEGISTSLIVGYLEHEGPHFRSLAARMLGMMNDRKAIPALIAALKDTSETVRISAIQSIVWLRATDAGSNLIELTISDPDVCVRREAIIALGALKVQDAVPELIPLLNDKSECHHRRICDAVCTALEKIGTEEALRATQQWRQGVWK